MSSYAKRNRPPKGIAPPKGKPGIKQTKQMRGSQRGKHPKGKESEEEYKMGTLKPTEEASRRVGMVRKVEFNAKDGAWPMKMQILTLKTQCMT